MSIENMELPPEETALNLTLKGTIGSFELGLIEDIDKSLEVLYLMTHIGFDPNVASNDGVLKMLAPVREIFNFKELEFEEIMQRDIDDARVSAELIPYLLDANASKKIKFFPPIVIAVLPKKHLSTNPQTHYPKITRTQLTSPGISRPQNIIQSGPTGAEAFQFSNIDDRNGNPNLYDNARLKLNTDKVKLVIIDGQHRAMALLALYRNLNEGEWNDARRAPFKDYYLEWTRAKILEFNLTKIQLPIIVCTYPNLDSEYLGDFNVIKAARSTFLTLNKNARKVSRTRNILLDDRDLISHFLRHTLSQIKKKDLHSDSSFRIHNVELDQSEDQIKIESPIACTGLSHIHYAIEHMMLDENDVNGLSARAGRFSKRTTVTSLLRRLDGENLIGQEAANALKRDMYTADAAKNLSDEFNNKYGCFLVGAFDKFMPYEIHNNATLDIENELQRQVIKPAIRNILYEGQNIGRTFTEHLQNMLDKERNARKMRIPLSPEFQTGLGGLKNTQQMVKETCEKMKQLRAKLFIDAIPEKNKLKIEPNGEVSNNLIKLINRLYDNVFTTVAFQAALVCGYFLVIEKAERSAHHPNVPKRENSFKEYIELLNDYFLPKTIPQLKKLIKTFFCEVKGERAEDWKEVTTTDNFKSVVFPEEMKPDEFPKYRYLILELWHSKDPFIKAETNEQRKFCRSQAFKSLYDRTLNEMCKANDWDKQNLNDQKLKDIFDRSFKMYNGFLFNLGINNKEERLNEKDAKEAIATPQVDQEDINEELEP